MSVGDNAAAGRPVRAPWERWQLPPAAEPDAVYDYPEDPPPDSPDPDDNADTAEIPTGSHATGELTVAELIARIGGADAAAAPPPRRRGAAPADPGPDRTAPASAPPDDPNARAAPRVHQ